MEIEADRRPTIRGARLCSQWLVTCRKLGWPASVTGQLCDLWWEHHDDNGDLREPFQPSESLK